MSAKAFPRRPPDPPARCRIRRPHRHSGRLPRPGQGSPSGHRLGPRQRCPRRKPHLSPQTLPLPLRDSPAGQGLLSNTSKTSVITRTKTIMQEPLAHFPKIRHGRQSTHDLQSLLPVTELGPVSPYSMTQRERRNAICSDGPDAGDQTQPTEEKSHPWATESTPRFPRGGRAHRRQAGIGNPAASRWPTAMCSPSASSARCGPPRPCPARAISSHRSLSPSWCRPGPDRRSSPRRRTP